MDHTHRLCTDAAEFGRAADAFAARFKQLMDEVRSRLGGLFRADDYPCAAGIREKFAFETRVLPLPDAGDSGWRSETRSGSGSSEIKASVEASLTIGSQDLWQRLDEAVFHMAERPSAYAVSEEGVTLPFRDSVVTNFVRLVLVLPKLNVTGDPELEQLTAQGHPAH